MPILIPRFMCNSQGLTLRQQFPTGGQVTGTRSAHVEMRSEPGLDSFPDLKLANAVMLPGGIVQLDAEPSAATGGLFELRLHTPLQRRHIFATALNVRVGGTVAWTLHATDGRGTGSATDVDDAAYDIPVASGSGNKYERVAFELIPGASLRFKTSANLVLDPAMVEITFIMLSDTHARPIA